MNSPLNFEYDVCYYIPATLKNAKDLKVLSFLHDRGKSTLLRRGSNQSIKDYAFDLNKMGLSVHSMGAMAITRSAL
jgi:hypothetical protein